ncbi:MAG: Cold shock-like protein [Phycisphaerae bacterium]|nr:Cold shock-like protein [Phycisphaerae bacterium]
MPHGRVKWFDSKKGFGFIVGEEGQDVFVHYTNIDGEGFRALKDGELVEYEARTSEKGLQASKVRLARASPAQ